MALNQPAITAFAQTLLAHLEALVAPLAWLEHRLAPWREDLDPALAALIVWAWQHRSPLALEAGEGFPVDLQSVVHAFWEALSLFHRSSSLAEALQSWRRPHLQIHRGMPRGLLPLLQLFWNHHSFQRGTRAGKSPLELAGVAAPPSLSEVLNRLFRAEATAQAMACPRELAEGLAMLSFAEARDNVGCPALTAQVAA